jgi:hypothetical protein
MPAQGALRFVAARLADGLIAHQRLISSQACSPVSGHAMQRLPLHNSRDAALRCCMLGCRCNTLESDRLPAWAPQGVKWANYTDFESGGLQLDLAAAQAFLAAVNITAAA